jgi:hypothetical protein
VPRRPRDSVVIAELRTSPRSRIRDSGARLNEREQLLVPFTA